MALIPWVILQNFRHLHLIVAWVSCLFSIPYPLPGALCSVSALQNLDRLFDNCKIQSSVTCQNKQHWPGDAEDYICDLRDDNKQTNIPCFSKIFNTYAKSIWCLSNNTVFSSCNTIGVYRYSMSFIEFVIFIIYKQVSKSQQVHMKMTTSLNKKQISYWA